MITPRGQLEGELLAQIEMLFSYRKRAFCAQPHLREISLPQLHLLMSLQDRGRTTVSELAQLLGISAPSASAIVDRMEEHGMVSRVRNDVDRRVVHVAISPHGQSIVEEMVGIKRERMQALLNAMSDGELQDVLRGATAFRTVLDRLQAAAPAEVIRAG